MKLSQAILSGLFVGAVALITGQKAEAQTRKDPYFKDGDRTIKLDDTFFNSPAYKINKVRVVNEMYAINYTPHENSLQNPRNNITIYTKKAEKDNAVHWNDVAKIAINEHGKRINEKPAITTLMADFNKGKLTVAFQTNASGTHSVSVPEATRIINDKLKL